MGGESNLFVEDLDVPEAVHLQKSEEQASRDVSLFASIVYVKNWFRAPDILSAPASDLAFLKNVYEYQVVQSDVAQVAFTAMARNL